MDTMRGSFGSLAESDSHYQPDEESGSEAPPTAIGQDERRMQVRAYNHWASLLEDRNFPSIEDLEPEKLPDFSPHSVLLDFSSGIEDPGIAFLGDKLAAECDVGDGELNTLADVPSRSLLSRITDHYMQIITNQAPIGFEAEFVNQRGATIAYRGILLPFSSDDDIIDFIYGVINWKELADAQESDELLLEVDQALASAGFEGDGPLTGRDDGLGGLAANDMLDGGKEDAAVGAYLSDDFGEADSGPEVHEDDLPRPSFGLDDEDDAPDAQPARGPQFGSLLKMPLQLSPKPRELTDEHFAANYGETREESVADLSAPGPFEPARHQSLLPQASSPDTAVSQAWASESGPGHEIALPEIDPSEMELGDWLAVAREMAAAARASEERTREALYEAIGRAYDFSLAAAARPVDFDELLIDSGLARQDRAPMTPVVKLVFGAGYDKTRLTEYAAALSHAHRLELPRGTLGDYLGKADGGLKGVVNAERRMRREEAGKAVDPIGTPRQVLARKLRAMPAKDFEVIAPEGSEFALVMIRRTGEGDVAVLGEVPQDVTLIERAARRLLG